MRVVFWLSVAIGAYVYIAYPLILWIVTRRSARTSRNEALTPRVSLVIAAFNEEKLIEAKLQNSLSLDYPRDRLEILVASDGSTDRTDEIVGRFREQGVVLHRIEGRRGKTRALNQTVPLTTGEILVLSDANTFYRPDALRKLTRHFTDRSVGAVSGDVRLIDSADEYAASEGMYYRYERWLQTLESRLASIVGADGGMYALRRALFQPPAPTVIVDDFVISMTVATGGHRVLYDPEAIAIEQGTLSGREEWHRKVRIVAGGIHALKMREGVPTWRRPLLLWSYTSHKLLRWLLPVFLIAGFVASGALAAAPFYRDRKSVV